MDRSGALVKTLPVSCFPSAFVPGLESRLYFAVNVGFPVNVTRYEAPVAKEAPGPVIIADAPSAKLSDALCVSPPEASKLIQQPLLLAFVHVAVSMMSTLCVPLTLTAIEAAVPVAGAA